MLAQAQLAPDPARVAAGWERRFIADAERAAEAIQLYEELGYEVCADPLRPDDLAGECEDCRLLMLLQFKTIYTRSAPTEIVTMRCTRCGREAAETDKFCAECGMFLRDAWVDQRLLLAAARSRARASTRRRAASWSAWWRCSRAAPWLALSRHHALPPGHAQPGDRLLPQVTRPGTAASCCAGTTSAWRTTTGATCRRPSTPIRRCLEIDPHYNAAHYRLGVALFHAGDLDQAREHFEQCTALTPEYLLARYHVGVIHERQGDLPAPSASSAATWTRAWAR